MNGPFPAGDHNITVFRNEGLKDKIPSGKKAIGDNGYRGEDATSTPNAHDEAYESSKVALEPSTSLSMLG